MNRDLMRTFTEVCKMNVILPEDPSIPVVLGAAMLGRLAHVIMMTKKKGKDIGKEGQAAKLWDIMVGINKTCFPVIHLADMYRSR